MSIERSENARNVTTLSNACANLTSLARYNDTISYFDMALAIYLDDATALNNKNKIQGVLGKHK